MQSINKQTPRLLVLALTFLVVTALGVVILSRSGMTLAALPILDASTKTASSDTVSAGGSVDYFIVLRNNSVSESTGQVVVTDTLPADLTYTSQSLRVDPETAGTGLPITGGVKFTVGDMDPGDVVTLSFSVDVDGAVVPDTVITNEAEISWSGNVITRDAAITVEAAPVSKLVAPWDEQFVDEGKSFTISGRAWTAAQTPEYPGTPVLQDILYSPGANFFFVSWNAVPGSLAYVLQESDSVDFSSISYEDQNIATTTVQRTNMASGLYYYRVKARNAYGDSYWSNVVSVTVTSGSGFVPDLNTLGLTPSSVNAVSYQPVVEVNIKAVGGVDNWQTVTDVTDNAIGDWWDWTYDWDVPLDEGTEYVIQTRAKDLSGSQGEIDSVTVTLVSGISYAYMPIVLREYPPMPTLVVSADDGEGNFTLTWTIPASSWGVVKYQLQESESADFDVLTLNQSTTSLSRVFSDHDVGTFYFRVAGVNSSDEIAAWSNVVSVEVTGNDYFDDFSNRASGWPIATYYRGTTPDGQFFNVDYDAGTYRAKILLDYYSFNNRWMGIVKAPFVNDNASYEVQVKHYFTRAADQATAPSLGKAGLIFASNSNMTVFYQVEWNFDGGCAVAKYWNIAPPGGPWDPNNIAMAKTWGPCQNVLNVGYDQANIVKAVIGGNVATVYINGYEIAKVTSDEMYTFHTVGLTTGAFDRTPVESRFDNFTVTGR